MHLTTPWSRLFDKHLTVTTPPCLPLAFGKLGGRIGKSNQCIRCGINVLTDVSLCIVRLEAPASMPAIAADTAHSSLARVGDQARSSDARDGGGLVVVRVVAGNPNRTDNVAIGAADQHAARHGDQ